MAGDPGLVGRESEEAAVEQVLAAVRSGRSGALVVRGAPGVGKSALLESVSVAAHHLRVVQLRGSEPEAEFAFAGLHQLCSRLPTGIDALPGPQRQALGVALGIMDGDQPDLFLVGLATLSLISAVAGGQPCVFLIDDFQWLDQVSRRVFAFVARRIGVDPVGMFLATRELDDELAGIPEIRLDALGPADARHLLGRAISGPVAPTVGDLLLKLCDGNPLAILEIPRELSALELAGTVAFGGFPGQLSPVERSFERRIARLAPDTRTLLLIAAAEPQGRREAVYRAAQLLHIDPAALDAAERDGLARVGGDSVEFRHPLVRSAVYRAASPHQLREVHQALAAVSDPDLDGDRRAWHRALAAIGPDEEIAADLETSAALATERGGLGAAAALLGRAAALTPDPDRKGDRSLRAAAAAIDAGDLLGARGLLEATDDRRLSPFQLARKGQLDAKIGHALSPSRSAVERLIAAAAQILPFDANLARDTYLEALVASMYQTSSEGIHGWVEIARSLRALLDRSKPLTPADLMLDGLTTTMIDGHETSAPILRAAMDAYLSDDGSVEDALRWWQLGWWTAIELCDVAYVFVIDRTVQAARDLGSLAVLPFALFNQAVARTIAGRLDLAEAACEEAMEIFASIGQPMLPFPAPIIAAARGSEYSGTGEGVYGVFAQYYSAMLLANGHARFASGLAAAHQALHHDAMGKYLVWLDVIEIASRCNDRELSSAALREARATWMASGTDFAAGMLALCESFDAPQVDAESHYLEAINRLDRDEWRFYWARSHLVYGEWLRQEEREADATRHLVIAHEAMTKMGALAFAQRAERELVAAGGKPRNAPDKVITRLTPQENQIARLAAAGETNVEIGAQLFISPSTVDYHLRKVFKKLNISSRRSLAQVLSSARG